MITFDLASPLAWLLAIAATALAVWALGHGLSWLVENRAPRIWKVLGYSLPVACWHGWQAFLRLAHRLERLGIDLAERAGLVWPWPDSQLESLRTTFALSGSEAIMPGDRLKLASTGEVVRVVSVAQDFVANFGVTVEQAGRGAQAFAKVLNAWQNEITPGRQSATGKRN